MAFDTIVFRHDGSIQEEMPVEEISDRLDEGGCLVWLDVLDPSEADLDVLADEFGIHKLYIEDCVHGGQRPKVERDIESAFIVAYGISVPAEPADELALAELDIFVGPGYLITVRKNPVYDIAQTRARALSDDRLCQAGSGLLLYVILDDIVDGYFSASDRLEGRIDHIEADVFSQADAADGMSAEHRRWVQQEIFALRKQLVSFHKKVTAMREALLTLTRWDMPVLADAGQKIYFEDVYDHLIRVQDDLDTYRELVSGVLEAHLSVINNRMNEVMKKTSSWGAILLISTLIAGIYGMNFKNMPELSWALGYPVALGMMAIATAGLYWFFKRHDWL